MSASTAEEFLSRAIARAGDSEIIQAHGATIAPLLAENEVVLEAAETTAPGHETALFATDRRLLLVEGLSLVREAPYSMLTHVYGTTGADFTLTLCLFNRRIEWCGFGERGLRRVLNAIQWANRPVSRPEDSVENLFESWRDTRDQLRSLNTCDADYAQQIVTAVSNRRWW